MSGNRAMGVIKNPLTVISIFAGLAEVSATIALPQLSEAVQFQFVWFVMLFPTLLVILFFLTLWVKREAFYAPSDFTNEENFMKNLRHRPDRSEAGFVDEDAEIGEIDEGSIDSKTSQGNGGETIDTTQSTDAYKGDPAQDNVRGSISEKAIQSKYLEARLAEDLAIKRLSRDTGLNFLRDVAFSEAPDVYFDAVAKGPSGPVMVDVKRIHSSSRVLDVARRSFTRAVFSVGSLPEELRRGSRFILFLVVDHAIDPATKDGLNRMLFSQKVGVQFELRSVTFDELKRGVNQ